MKETFYFSHDYNAREDSKILNMLAELGWEGYGLYWMIVERLAEANGKLLLDDLKGIAFACQVEKEKLFLLVGNFSLFNKDEKYFWSSRLLVHLKKRQKLSQIRAKLGRKGGQAKVKQQLSNSPSKIKQSKVKEIKVKEIIKKLSNDSVLQTGDNYKPDHNPPKRKKVILSDKQKAVLKRMKCLDYFHSEGVKQGYDYLLEEDDQANRKFIGLARALEKRYPNNWKEAIDWWFKEDNAWCDYHPSHFFSISTWMKFDNKEKANKSKNIFD